MNRTNEICPRPDPVPPSRTVPHANPIYVTSVWSCESPAQADAILTMQLQRLVGLEIDKLTEEYNRLAEEIEGYEALLADHKLVLDVIREDTIEMKEKYGDRKSTRLNSSHT